MSPPAETIVLNGAPSQRDRWLRALDAAYAQVDGRSVSELLDFAVKFGRLIHFYDLKDRPDGDWVEFFLADPAMVLAAADAADLAGREAAFHRLVRQTAAERAFDRKLALLREVFAAILELARQIDGWLRGLDLSHSCDTVRLARRELAAAVQDNLGEALRRLKAFAEGALDALGQAIDLDTSDFLPLWDLGGVRPDGSIYRGATGRAKIQHALPSLTPLFHTLLDGSADFQAFARANLPSTREEGWHKPQLALYMAFVDLFGTAQATINTISSRYIRFYYDQILRESRRPAVPDSVYLTFALAEEEGVTRTTVPRGTLFPAGQDADGQDILYAADRNLGVTAAQIAQLRALRVLQGPLLPALTAGDNVACQILISEISTAAGGAGWATFGGDEVNATDAEVTTLASLGFALASEDLLLTGGERRVEITIQYTETTLATLRLLLGELAAAGFDPTRALREVLAGAFTLQVSTAEGWFELDGYEAAVPEPWDSAPQLILKLHLPSSVPAVETFDSEDPASALPTLQAWLRQEVVTLTAKDGLQAEVYPLSLLGGVEAAAFEIRTRVTGLSGLALTNTDGEVDPSTPFPLLGAVPVVGSYLEIRHPELFVKAPESLKIGIQWFALPPYDNGFAGYYRDYLIGLDGTRQPGLFDNQTFHASLRVQKPGAWRLEETADLFLFRTTNDCGGSTPTPDGALCNETIFKGLAIADGEAPPYYDPTASALRLELTAPPYAFGNDLYAQNVLNAVIQDLPDIPVCEEVCATECAPFQQAARCLEACLEHCKDVPEDQYAACIKPRVEKCQEALLLAVIESFLACLESCGLDLEKLADFRACLQTCMTLPPAKRPLCLKACVEELRAGALLPCVEDCLKKSLELLEALLWIQTCVAGCEASSNPKECFTACLAACVARLDAAYDDCLQTCMAACTKPKDANYPNPPWLPQAQSVTLDYTTFSVLAPGMVFHLLPFGGWKPAGAPGGSAVPLLPQLHHPGNLYLGFSGLLPSQRLNLLFQMASSGSEAGLPPVTWSCLSADEWQPLKTSEILSDTTNGLANTGVVALSLPAFDPADPTFLPGGSQWLRAAVPGEPGRFPRTAGIYPHVLTVTWQDNGGTGESLRQPLPANTIASSVQDLAFIATIAQPLESFGGRPPEDQRNLDIRVGERLRHKDRALLAWDYERLVLERFPTVWKVQALPARNTTQGDAPGDVLVVIVPGPESQQVQDPTTPVAPVDLLHQIQEYLAERTSPFVRLQVVNPNYVRIQVTASVLFREEDDPGDDIAKLNADLVHYLSPWYYDAARADREGRYAMEDDISEFVQTRPYVAALEAIEFSYDPPVRPEWYFLTSAAGHDIQDV